MAEDDQEDLGREVEEGGRPGGTGRPWDHLGLWGTQ